MCLEVLKTNYVLGNVRAFMDFHSPCSQRGAMLSSYIFWM